MKSPLKLIRLVKITLQNSKGVVKIHGVFSKEFDIKKGFEQGNPLSPVGLQPYFIYVRKGVLETHTRGRKAVEQVGNKIPHQNIKKSFVDERK